MSVPQFLGQPLAGPVMLTLLMIAVSGGCSWSRFMRS